MNDIVEQYQQYSKQWLAELEDLFVFVFVFVFVAHRFGRREMQERALDYLIGLLRPVERAVAAKVPFAWITGDEIYGDDRRLRVWLEQSELHFVLAVASNQYVWTTAFKQATVTQLVESMPELAWHTLSAGDGAKGARLYEWAAIPLLSWQMPGQRCLLLRRSLTDGKLAYYVCYAPRETTLTELVRVAGTRWTIEECFEAAKGEVGLDHYEVRSWHGWYRHITLAMLAHAYLANLRAHAIDDGSVKKKTRSQSMMDWKEERRLYIASH